ncbi:hypothetical protein HKCCE3408_03390 [Rhodobacterales bacterium HKCCE3408]|nr:hypothetical protein [Rhodobacterales bacterium HKCCE3408]
MRILRNILIAVAVIILLFFGIGLLLPRTVTVEREIVIDAPADEIFPYVNSLERAAEWSPWLSLDPEAQVVYTGPDEGVGSTLEWMSDTLGTGRQEIVDSVENERVVSQLYFVGQGDATAWVDLVPFGEGTEVVWGLQADMGASPIGRWVGLAVARAIRSDYDEGLQQLKSLVEG